MTEPPRSSPPNPPFRSSRSSRFTGKGPTVLLALLGAGLVLLAGSRNWATVELGDYLPGISELTVRGGKAAPVLIPIALAAAAGAIVLATAGRIVRLPVAATVAIAGAVVAVSAVQLFQDSSTVVTAALRDSLGIDRGSGDGDVAGALVGGTTPVHFSAWIWVAAAGGVVIFVAGVLALGFSRTWPGPTRRYERQTAPGAPTAPAARAGSGGRAARAAVPPVPGADPMPAVPESPAQTWDALSRGEDPTSTSGGPT